MNLKKPGRLVSTPVPGNINNMERKEKELGTMVNVRKAAVIGCGFVGASIAFSLMQRGLYSELVLIDANREKAEGEAMDLSHGLPYAASMNIYAGTYDDVADCAMVILTAGANQKPGETRLDLIGKNVAILKSILPELTSRNFQGILLVSRKAGAALKIHRIQRLVRAV